MPGSSSAIRASRIRGVLPICDRMEPDFSKTVGVFSIWLNGKELRSHFNTAFLDTKFLPNRCHYELWSQKCFFIPIGVTAPKREEIMAQSIATGAEGTFSTPERRVTAARASSPAYQAYQILHLAFVVAPVLAGLDKFFHILVNWDMYLAPAIAKLSPVSPHDLMLAVGVIEIIAGILVAIKPR